MQLPRLASALVLALSAASAFADAPQPDPVPSTSQKGPYLFCYFYGNGDGLHLAASSDGLAFTPLNDDKPYLRPTIGNGLMRDPCIRQGADGIYHLVWTTGWWDQGFGVASSPDLVHWSEQLYVDANKAHPDAVNTWAPELFFNDQKNEWMIFWATTLPGQFKETQLDGGKGDSGPNKSISLNHRIYYNTTKDFKTFSDTKLLVDPGYNCIDATLAKVPATIPDVGGKYLMVIKDETKAPVPAKNLRTLIADNPEGPWKPLSAGPITPDKLWVEGPTLVQVDDTFYVYYDEYQKRSYGAMTTKDFKTWKVVEGNFKVPSASRHGTVFPVAQSTLHRLQSLPPINLPEPVRNEPASRGPSANPKPASTQP